MLLYMCQACKLTCTLTEVTNITILIFMTTESLITISSVMYQYGNDIKQIEFNCSEVYFKSKYT